MVFLDMSWGWNGMCRKSCSSFQGGVTGRGGRNGSLSCVTNLVMESWKSVDRFSCVLPILLSRRKSSLTIRRKSFWSVFWR